MIKYQLICHHGHEFEGWFRDSETFDRQVAVDQVSCPRCGSASIAKAIMSPSLSMGERHPGSGQDIRQQGTAPENQTALAMARRFRAELEAKADYVGRSFANEVRKMHFDETPARSIWGEASVSEVCDLIEDDIPVLPVPKLPEDLD